MGKASVTMFAGKRDYRVMRLFESLTMEEFLEKRTNLSNVTFLEFMAKRAIEYDARYTGRIVDGAFWVNEKGMVTLKLGPSSVAFPYETVIRDHDMILVLLSRSCDDYREINGPESRYVERISESQGDGPHAD